MFDKPILKPNAVALVTGASAGIGTAIAEALVAKDCQVICSGRRRDRLEALAERLGDNCHAVELDVADAGATAGLIDNLPEGLRDIGFLARMHEIGPSGEAVRLHVAYLPNEEDIDPCDIHIY